MTIWGKTADGVDVPIYTLKSAMVEARVMAYGAKLVSVRTADRAGKVADVVLGFDNLADFLRNPNPHFGSVVGRFGNRIAKGQFSIDGVSYQIPINNGPNALHGGPVGFDKYVWQAAETAEGAEFIHVSPDGDMGFPGTLTAKVRYSVEGNTLRIDYEATTDKATHVNLTNHAYFNLHGDDAGDVLDQEMQLWADRFTPVDGGLIPTGELRAVEGTPLDFRRSTVIGARIEDGYEQMKLGNGYDHNFQVNGEPGTLRTAAVATDTKSGRRMTVQTTEPGVQFYSGNFLDGGFTGRYGTKYGKRTGFCLETQHFPDSPNHPEFPSTLLRPGQTYRSTTTFAFDTV